MVAGRKDTVFGVALKSKGKAGARGGVHVGGEARGGGGRCKRGVGRQVMEVDKVGKAGDV